MNRMPKDLDLGPMVGKSITQLCVGKFDLQFSVGPFHFMVESPVTLLRRGKLMAGWAPGKWPEPEFFHLMNSAVHRCWIASDRLLVIEVENGLAMHLEDSSDEHECLHVAVEGVGTWDI
jgi:hypothetical protein